MRSRIHGAPPLIVGTHSYRRAMAELDVDGVQSRIEEDAGAAFERQY